MWMRKLIAGPLLVFAFMIVGCDDDEDPTSLAREYGATLTGANEVPPVTTTATGAAGRQGRYS